MWCSTSMDSTAKGRPCVYDTVMGWGGMSCVYGMAFLCGSTLIKVYYCHKQTLWRYDLGCLKAMLNPKQTNKKYNAFEIVIYRWPTGAFLPYFDNEWFTFRSGGLLVGEISFWRLWILIIISSYVFDLEYLCIMYQPITEIRSESGHI